jgi:hypothetical protein
LVKQVIFFPTGNQIEIYRTMKSHRHVIHVPRILNLENSLNFCCDLWKIPEANEYEFNFSALSTVEPFTMAFVANEIKRYRDSKQAVRFFATNHENKTYPAHMGFFKAFGLEFGKEPGEASGSSTYIPLTILKVEDIVNQALQEYEEPGAIIERHAEKIAKILTRCDRGDLVDALTFSIREVMRNIVEHSGSSFIEYCAQYWPTKNLVEVAILDGGNGIKYGLSPNPYLEIQTERDALHMAMLPGVSGKMYKGVKRQSNNVWQNSGYGLYMTSRICRNGGDFFIVSNDACLLLSSDSKEDLKVNSKGTSLRLRIDTTKIENYSGMLSKFRREGAAVAKELSGFDAIEPSVASTMLMRDFQSAN